MVNEFYNYSQFICSAKKVILEVGLREGYVSGCDKEFFDASADSYKQKGIAVGLAYSDNLCPRLKKIVARHIPNDLYPKTFFICDRKVVGVEGGYWDANTLENAIAKYFK